MKYRPLGSTGIDVSEISLGVWQLGDPDYWGESAAGNAKEIIGTAIDQGINLFDTAEMYGSGESERTLAKALGPNRDKVLIASKVADSHCRPEDVRAACEDSLRHLATDRIDLYQVHWPSRVIPFADTYGELKRLQDEGKIRAIGVSNFGATQLDEWAQLAPPASNQLGYNLLFRAIEFDIVPACERINLGILAYMPLMQGLLSGRWDTVEEIPESRRRSRHFSSASEIVRHGEAGHEEVTLKTVRALRGLAGEFGHPLATVATAWLLSRPAVTTVIMGASRGDQVVRNVEAASVTLPPGAIARLDAASAALKEAMGPNADQWQGGENSRVR